MTRTEGRDMAKSFDRIADRFDQTRSYPDEVMARVLEAVAGAMEPGSGVLDAGAGTGRFALPLQRRGFEVVGVDVSRRMLGKAADKGARDLVMSDVCALPFRDMSFDYALSVHLIHLIPDWRVALSEIGRVTRTALVSVVSDKAGSEVEAVRECYRGACRDLGYEVRHAGPMERELPAFLAPDSKVRVTAHEAPVDVRAILDDYETRTFSDQWDVPEEVHRRAVGALRERYGGAGTVVRREEISLLVWGADRVRAAGRGTC